jgi:hypothetical protein
MRPLALRELAGGYFRNRLKTSGAESTRAVPATRDTTKYGMALFRGLDLLILVTWIVT